MTIMWKFLSKKSECFFERNFNFQITNPKFTKTKGWNLEFFFWDLIFKEYLGIYVFATKLSTVGFASHNQQ